MRPPRACLSAIVAAGLLAGTLAGCGRLGFGSDRDAATSGDAGGPDAVVIADRINVVTRERGTMPGPAAGVVVWTSHIDGALDDLAMSDEGGHAALRADPGGSVSVAYPGPPYLVRTVAGVELGDVIRFGADENPCDGTPRGSATIRFTPLQGAQGYAVMARCATVFAGPTATSIVLPLTAGIPDPMDIVLRATDGTNILIASAVRLAVPLPDGADVVFTAADWAAPVQHTLGVSGLPAFATDGEMFIDFHTSLDPASGGGDYLFGPTSGGALVATVPAPDRADEMIVVWGSATGSPSDHAIGFQHVFTPASGGDSVVPLTMPSLVNAMTYDESSRLISWNEVAGPTDRLSVLVGYPPSYTWMVQHAGGATSVTLPEPPQGVTDLMPGVPPAIEVMALTFNPRLPWSVIRQRPEWAALLPDEQFVSARRSIVNAP